MRVQAGRAPRADRILIAPGWRNWQTQRTQNPPRATSWGFDPPSRHHRDRKLCGFHETHCSRIYAVAETGGARAVVEDMAEMSIALTAGNCCTFYPHAQVMCFDD